MKKITIEFFHDIICSFCFPMAHNIRKIQAKFDNIEIIHRSFALTTTDNDYIEMFGSLKNAKEEILKHWEHANLLDENSRFNIDGMQKATFNFPISTPALYACKAASFIGSEEAYFSMFDRLQTAFFVESKDVSNEEVIKQCAIDCGFDLDVFLRNWSAEQTKQSVLTDCSLASSYGISVVPTLVHNEKIIAQGAIPFDVISAKIESLF